MQWIVSLTPECTGSPLEALGKAPKQASMVEVRLDLFPSLDPQAAVEACPLPVLLTLRSEVEGGRASMDATIRRKILTRAWKAGPALIDLEWQRDLELSRELGLPPENILLSTHDPDGIPENPGEIAAGLLDTPCALAKVVTHPNCFQDLIKILQLFSSAGGFDKKELRRLMAFGMGAIGLPSRFLSPLLGSPLGFASWQDGAGAAPGQKTAEEMEAVCGHLKGRPSRIFGVIGAEVSLSLSPRLHAAAYRSLGLPYLFLPLSVPALEELDLLFRPAGETCFDELGLAAGGWAVTRPYKEVAASIADFRAPRVRRAGAANTLILKEKQIIAENTDADGVTGSLKAAGVKLSGKTAIIQGTGGAARGAAVGLDLAGATVSLRGRNRKGCETLARELGIEAISEDCSSEHAILINATPLGASQADPLPFSTEEIDACDGVLDMVYAREETPLIRRARQAEKTIVDGRTMLAFQGMAQIAVFTMSVPPREEMLAALSGFEQE